MTPLLYAIAVAQEPLFQVLRETIGEDTVYGFADGELVQRWAEHHALVACLVELREFGRITPDRWEVDFSEEKVCARLIRRSRWTPVMEWAPPVATEDDVQHMTRDAA